MDVDDRCITADSLLKGLTLSCTEQPYFNELIQSLRTRDGHLVIIAGAGISMAAGLPSWHALIKGLEDELVPEELQSTFRALNADDLERRTDTVLFLTGETHLNGKNLKHLKQALYTDAEEPEPSYSAQAIAQIAAIYPKRVSVLTTNFDEVLETAMREVFGEAVASHAFSSWDEWESLDDDSHRSAIMHLHGLVYPDDRESLRPLVLSESEFRRYGPDIQEKLRPLFTESNVLIVGASLSDRNIATPMALTKGSPGSRFTVATPTLTVDGLDSARCADVAVWQAKSLKKALGVKPILLQTYAQVAQLLTECALAAHSPQVYRRPSRGVRVADSLHYGTRFESALKDAYRTLGASPRDGAMNDWDAIALSSRLNKLTHAKDGPNARLTELRRRHKGRCADAENIGIFLWLRDLPARPGSRFALRLMVSSAYAHWKTWSAFRLEPLEAGSPSAPVQAAFLGRAIFANVPRTHSGSWQGAWAQPLMVGFNALDDEIAGWPLDQLQLGAVAVNTDRKVTTGHEDQDVQGLSALAVLSQEEMAYFSEALDAVVENLLA